jgi:hypothetical protein
MSMDCRLFLDVYGCGVPDAVAVNPTKRSFLEIKKRSGSGDRLDLDIGAVKTFRSGADFIKPIRKKFPDKKFLCN